MDLTIVICTHNRSRLLDLLLDSLIAMERPESFSFETLVIANACRDDTLQLLKRSEARFSQRSLILRWHEEETPGKSHALNRALRLIRGEATLFVDDDQRVDRSLLRAVCEALARYPDINLFCGRLLPDWNGTEPRWLHEAGRYRIFPPPITTFDAGVAEKDLSTAAFKPPGGDLLIRTSLLSRLGPFSTELGPKGNDMGSGEDSEYLKRALNAGELLYYIPTIIQLHHVDPKRLHLSAIMRLAYQRSRASAKIHSKHDGVPLYLWRKLATYFTRAIFSINAQRSRFFLVRCSATLGEMRGLRELAAKKCRH